MDVAGERHPLVLKGRGECTLNLTSEESNFSPGKRGRHFKPDILNSLIMKAHKAFQTRQFEVRFAVALQEPRHVACIRFCTARRSARQIPQHLETLTMKIPSLNKLLEDQLKDLHSAENQLVKALPKIAKVANSDELKEAISSHLEETRGHVARLDRAGKMLGLKLSGKKCAAMEGLLEEGKEALEAEGPRRLSTSPSSRRPESRALRESRHGSARAGRAPWLC